MQHLSLGRKGHYKELFVQIRKKGFSNVRVDGEILEIKKNMQLDRYVIHDIEIVVDKLLLDGNNLNRLANSVDIAIKSGDGTLYVIDESDNSKFYSKSLVDPISGISYEERLLIVFLLIHHMVGAHHVKDWVLKIRY